MTSDGMSPADIAAVTGNRMNNGVGYDGGGLWWIIILFLFGMFNGGWGNNGMNNGGMLYPWLNNSNQINDGFQNQMLYGNINGIRDNINGLSNQMCNGFSQAEISANNRQMANMQQMFGLSQQLSDACGENRLATVQTQNMVQNEGANTRLFVQDKTQAIMDKLCQLELDTVKTQLAQAQRENVGLQNQLNMANLAASQIAQDARIVDGIYNRLATCPVGTQPVYGNQPIFTCNGNNGCGCGMNA